MHDQSTSNLEWFKSRLPELLSVHRGKHALLHDRGVIGFYESSLEAILDGMNRFGEGRFSVEPVDDTVEDLGFYSHVSSALHA